MTLLIVDDNEEVRRMLKKVLRDEFKEIRECEDGSQALEAYENFHPDWVLMDIQMKEMDGMTASKEILKLFPDAKIIIVTGFNFPALEKKAKSIGVTAYVLKENIDSIKQIIN